MRTRVGHTTRLFALGLLLTVGVAWYCALWSGDARVYAPPQHDDYNGEEPTPSEREWLAHIGYQRAPGTHLYVDRLSDLGFERDLFYEVRGTAYQTVRELSTTAGGSVEAVAIRTQAGWPLRSMSGGQLIDRHLAYLRSITLYNGDTWTYIRATPVQVPIARLGERARPLPLSPIPAGLVVNSSAFALSYWVVFYGPRLVLRCIRYARGQCPRCAYPRGTNKVCTECGHPVLARPTADAAT